MVDIPPGSEDHVLNGSLSTSGRCRWKTSADSARTRVAAPGTFFPPGWEGEAPDGYLVLQADTNRVYALLRSVLPERTQEALDAGLEYCRGIRVYPLAQADAPAETPRRDLQGELVDTRIPYDIRFWEALDRVVQAEPWLPRDRVIAEMLRTVGIERGKPFAPDRHRVELLESAVQEAHAWLRHLYENQRPFNEGRQWFFPAGKDFIEGQGTNLANSQVYPYTDRGVIYHMAFIGLKRLGVGQFYLVDLRDRNGDLLRSDRTYRLRVPAGVPVSQYWSVAMYDGDDHTFIRGNQKYSVSAQTPGLVVNGDGSVDVYFGPQAVTGLQSNFIETGDSQTFELMFRFYGVGQEVMTKQWALDDVEPVDPNQLNAQTP